MSLPNHKERWFRRSSWLWFSRGQRVEVELHTGQTAEYLGWRRAHVPSKVPGVPGWFGPALRFRMNEGNPPVSHGWDPAAVVTWKRI